MYKYRMMSQVVKYRNEEGNTIEETRYFPHKLDSDGNTIELGYFTSHEEAMKVINLHKEQDKAND